MNSSPYSSEILLEMLKELREIKQFLVGLDINKPVNTYGENFADAIQNGIERGLRRIKSNDPRS